MVLILDLEVLVVEIICLSNRPRALVTWVLCVHLKICLGYANHQRKIEGEKLIPGHGTVSFFTSLTKLANTNFHHFFFFCQPDQACELPTVQRSGSHQSQILWQRIWYLIDWLELQTIQSNLQQRSPWPPDGLVCCREGPHRPLCQVRCCNPTIINLFTLKSLMPGTPTWRPHWKVRPESGTAQSSESQSSLAFSMPLSTAAMPASAQKSALFTAAVSMQLYNWITH